MVDWARARREAIRKQAELLRRLTAAQRAPAGRGAPRPGRPAGSAKCFFTGALTRFCISGERALHLSLEISPHGGGRRAKGNRMGRFRSLAAQSPAIVISILAVALSLGG